MIPVFRNVDSPNGDFGLDRQEGDEEFVVLTKAEYARLGEAEARANTAKVAADLMLARAEKAEAALRRIMAHPNAVFNVAAVGYGEPTILKIATAALAQRGGG